MFRAFFCRLTEILEIFMKFQISRQIQTGCAGAFVYDRGVPKTIFSVFEKGMTYMQTITQEYLLLFNAITDAEEVLYQLRVKLIEAQRQAEELFLERESDPEQPA